jgi:hypothetical protein
MTADVDSRSVPRATMLGIVTIVVGLATDLVEHTVVSHAHDAIVAGFALGEHAAHLLVLVGMVLVLGGIVADGMRAARRTIRQEGSSSSAVR